jgi:outer membrane protein OmpA-like peptidoglycan-associated protein
VGRWIAIVGFAVLIAGVAISDYAGYRSLKEMRGELRSLRQDLNEASRTAQEQSAAVSAASRRAEEAAARAAVAADLRQQAESGRHQAENVAQQAQAAAQQATEQSRAAQEKMTEMQRERQAELDQTPNGMIISLPNSVFRFDFDRADLNPRNRELLSRIAGILLVSKGYGLSVFGYTDDVGTAEYNQQLSLKRANAVKDYLIQAGIDPAIVNVKGYGKTSPLIENTSDEGRAKNRRVEIALTDSSIRFQ